MTRGLYGPAFAALRDAARLDLDAEQRADVDRLERELRANVRDRARAAAESASAGRVLEAALLLAAFAATSVEDATARACLREASEAAGWPRLDGPWSAPGDRVAAPAAISRGRELRCTIDAERITATAVRAEGADSICVEVRAAAGLRWPVIARTQVEPVDATAAEALAQAAAALRAGERVLAAAWLQRARAKGAEPSRIARVEDWLAGSVPAESPR